jgi:hypothetical protein
VRGARPAGACPGFSPDPGGLADTEAAHAAIDGQIGTGGGSGGRAGQVRDGVGHLIGGGQATDGLAGVERDTFRLGVLGTL